MKSAKDSFTTVPQEILDRLTKIHMPSVKKADPSSEIIKIGDLIVPLYRCEALVLGSGAAGMRAAVEMKRRDIDVLVASTGLFSGTSACSGSDKQTIYTASTDFKGDNYIEYAKSLCNGGCMNFSTAYIEAVGSIDAIGGLNYMGLPLPHDDYGAILRYQTDHDEAGRATSCGPRTSKLMVKVLFEEAVKLGIRMLSNCSAIQIVKDTTGDSEKTVGVIAIHHQENRNKFGLVFMQCNDVIISMGGPGELYRDSVYPKHCYGGLGIALDAGLSLCNLTESQFGIGTPRTTFPWNLSGTYVQVMPRVYSIDSEGNEINFLAKYYRTTREMVSNTFRKGYQWPYHSTRMLNYSSSLFDLAVHLEKQAGRKVYLDFLKNPEAINEGEYFSLEDLDSDVRAYLENNDAMQDLPIDRLRKMNPLAIELFRMHGTDLCKEPLEFALNNQHMNGGILIDDWGKTTLKNCYSIGEAAGSHGVTRPGGAALNSGQVFGKRVAVAIYRDRLNRTNKEIKDEVVIASLEQFVNEAESFLQGNGLCPNEVREEIQNRMSNHAGILCSAENVSSALMEAQDLNRRIAVEGLKVSSSADTVKAFRWKQMAKTSEAVLTALDHYISNGGGSRGARAICSPEGTSCPEANKVDLSTFRFVEEKEADKEEKLVIRPDEKGFVLESHPVNMTPEIKRDFFEKGWGSYLIKQG